MSVFTAEELAAVRRHAESFAGREYVEREAELWEGLAAKILAQMTASLILDPDLRDARRQEFKEGMARLLDLYGRGRKLDSTLVVFCAKQLLRGS